MRDLKFKVWIPYRKIMMQPKSIRTFHEEIISGVTIGQMKQWVYLQFTGLTDKNGKEIYEGDVKREESEYDNGDQREYYVCVYIQEWCRFAWLHLTGEYNEYLDTGIEHLDESMQETFGIFENETDKTVICGNIYEQPEYLKYSNKYNNQIEQE